MRGAGKIRRRITGSLLAVSTAAAMALPPSHIHLATHDHDHDAGIEHAHWSPHGAASRVAIDDDDGRAIFVDHPALVRAAHGHIPQPQAIVVATLVPLYTQAFTVSGQRLAGNAPRDGPLDASTLRGPPLVV